jgi:hypothetical protein
MGRTHIDTVLDAERQARVCRGCGELKPFADFYRCHTGSNGHQARCKPCMSEKGREHIRQRKYYYKDVEKTRILARKRKTAERCRQYVLKSKYNLTPEAWIAMFDAQGNKCAICGTTEPGTKHAKWDTDHNHATGKVRGILCAACNRLLGSARDSQRVLSNAINYLST